ncbi:hypothetical protein B0H13DRAFT_1881285 [Mycena leptocephala]|nr:hypothetical protein B0H13DRAFT_1881285 [Mycena leptocephala]
MPRTFYVVPASSNGLFQGNPAAVVLIDELLVTDMLMKIAADFNQPIMSPSKSREMRGRRSRLVASASHGEELFISRTFGPSVHAPPASEDHVCGLAHCLPGPYWYTKSGLGAEQAFTAKQLLKLKGETIQQFPNLVYLGKVNHLSTACLALQNSPVQSY